jgi:hypothetical protein
MEVANYTVSFWTLLVKLKPVYQHGCKFYKIKVKLCSRDLMLLRFMWIILKNASFSNAFNMEKYQFIWWSYLALGDTILAFDKEFPCGDIFPRAIFHYQTSGVYHTCANTPCRTSNLMRGSGNICLITVTSSHQTLALMVLSGWCALALAPKSDKDPARGFAPPAKPPVDEIDTRVEDNLIRECQQQQDRKRDRRELCCCF